MKQHKIAIISDTHLKTSWYKAGMFDGVDILIHCGDFTNSGSIPNMMEFIQFFKEIPVEHKIVVPGNHDFACEKYPQLAESDFTEADIILLNHKRFEFNGFKIFGTPVQPVFLNWAFNFEEDKRKQYFEEIPEDTNLLITHCPPLGILDSISPHTPNLGDRVLSESISKLKHLKVHCFGHIHGGYGQKEVSGVKYINAAICDEAYLDINKPVVIEL